MNLFSLLKIQIDETGAAEALADTVNQLAEEEATQTLWQLIWGYNHETDSYSITSIVVMATLFVLSITSIYIFIERFLSIRRSLQEERDFMAKIKDYVKDGKLDAAQQLCISTDNPIARMVEKGLMRIGKPLKDISASIENVAKMEIYRLEARLSILATISAVAPMVGFLGTVLGMMSTFRVISQSPDFDIASISGGIMEAMVTTVGGLVVGIIAYVAYNYLISKVEKVIQKMEGGSMEFMDILEAPGH
ncbi:MAG: MotA/TolQ/ExbB proton channel family protein [Flavobacteriales bacterium]|jgi:biopolymer transport protein ExbB|nr:MotA/TolQ/ExbB proton channel family protein [Flavobacteriales bacterium]